VGYKEEIFSRLEMTGFTTKSEVQDWLSGQGTAHQKKRSGYSNFASELQEPFAIREELERIDDFDELRTLRNQAQTIGMSNARDTLVKDIEAKMSRVSNELAKITEERVKKRLEKERIEKTKIKLGKELDKIIDNIPDSTLGEIGRMEGKLNQIEEVEVDTSIARGLISERINEIEEEKELRISQQQEAREKKEALREQGIEPEF